MNIGHYSKLYCLPVIVNSNC